MTQRALPPKVLSLQVSAEADKALTRLLEPARNAFSAREDAVCEAILLIAWSALEVRRGGVLGSIWKDGKHYARLLTPFIARITGAGQVSEFQPAKPLSVTVPGEYVKAAERVLGWSSVAAFDNVNDFVSQALMLLDYAVDEIGKGNYLGSVNEKTEVVKKFYRPFMNRIRGGHAAGDGEVTEAGGGDSAESAHSQQAP